MRRFAAAALLAVSTLTVAPASASAVGGPCAGPPAPAGQSGTWAASIDIGQPAPGTVGGLYTQRGWSGWGTSHLYDPGCVEKAVRGIAGITPNPAAKAVKKDPFVLASEWELKVAALAGAAATALIRAATAPGAIWEALDVGEAGVRAVAGWHILASWLTFTMLAVGVWVMARARRDTLAQTWSQTLTALLFLAGGVFAAGWQVSVGPSIDAAITSTYRAAGQVATASDDPAAGFGDFYTERVMLPVWGAIHLGPNWQAVEEFAPRLYAAQSWTRAEEAAAKTDPAERERIVAAKAADYRTVVGEVAAKYPDAYAHLAGDTGRDARAATGLVGDLFAAVILMVVLPLAGFMAASRLVIRYGFAAWPGASVILAHPYAQAAGRVYVSEIVKWAGIGVGSTAGLVAFLRVISDVMGAPVAWVPRAIAASGLCLLLTWLWKHKRSDLTAKMRLQREAAAARYAWNSSPVRASRDAAAGAAGRAREAVRPVAADVGAGLKSAARESGANAVAASRAAARSARDGAAAGRARVAEVVASRRTRAARANSARIDPVAIPRKAGPEAVSQVVSRFRQSRPTAGSLWVREHVEVARRARPVVKAATKSTGSVARVSVSRAGVAAARMGKGAATASTGGVATAARVAAAVASVKRKKAGAKA